ncbi:MAG: hypothetical protein E6G28_03130 [Actinobacteria bacterium]|nr:MAG: hypothetical protein E6G28_03130 [Actinomycetota bacterium]
MLSLMTGCTGSARTPDVLMDGSTAARPRVDLEGVSAATVLTRFRVLIAGRVPKGSLAASCLQGPPRHRRPVGRLVERIGVDTESVSIRDSSGVNACDNSPGGREDDRRWCGSSFGRLVGGRLRDPRLDVGSCTTRDGKPLAFAWVDADARAKYVVVDQGRYAEAYEVAGGLPVRISTHDVQVGESRATFRISEHDGRGRLLRRFELTAVPAG